LMEDAASVLMQADIEQPYAFKDPLEELASALPAFSEAVAMTYFSHAEMERAT
jgi:hypothetical protein